MSYRIIISKPNIGDYEALVCSPPPPLIPKPNIEEYEALPPTALDIFS